MEEDKKIIKLNYPIPVKDANGNMINNYEIVLTRLKTKHLKLLPKSFFKKGKGSGQLSIEEAVPILASLSNLSQETVDMIDAQDISYVLEEMGNFFEQCLSPQTGKI